ncbi:MAG: zinc finger domain-containing protein [Solirubrobacteraceae bacterium]
MRARTIALHRAARRVACPTCGADAGERCRTLAPFSAPEGG